MTERLIKAINLKNGLSLEIHDRSRRVAADRWLVSFSARMSIPVNMLASAASDQIPFSIEDIRELLGENVSFEQIGERNFIDEKKRAAILDELIDSFLTSSVDYLSHPDFARRYILKEYQARLRQKKWYPNEEI